MVELARPSELPAKNFQPQAFIPQFSLETFTVVAIRAASGDMDGVRGKRKSAEHGKYEKKMKAQEGPG